MSYSFSAVLFVSVATGTCLPNLSPAMNYSAAIRYSGKMLTEPLPNNGHISRNIFLWWESRKERDHQEN
jgi:hypothetical protein